MPKGDDKQARIHELAKSLKDLHLAGSMEEALKRAKEVLEGEEGGKSIRQLMDEAEGKVGKEATEEEQQIEDSRSELEEDEAPLAKGVKADVKSARRDKTQVEHMGKAVETTGRLHKLEKGDTKDALHEVDDIECAIEDAETIVKQAEKVQKKDKKK